MRRLKFGKSPVSLPRPAAPGTSPPRPGPAKPARGAAAGARRAGAAPLPSARPSPQRPRRPPPPRPATAACLSPRAATDMSDCRHNPSRPRGERPALPPPPPRPAASPQPPDRQQSGGSGATVPGPAAPARRHAARGRPQAPPAAGLPRTMVEAAGPERRPAHGSLWEREGRFEPEGAERVRPPAPRHRQPHRAAPLPRGGARPDGRGPARRTRGLPGPYSWASAGAARPRPPGQGWHLRALCARTGKHRGRIHSRPRVPDRGTGMPISEDSNLLSRLSVVSRGGTLVFKFLIVHFVLEIKAIKTQRENNLGDLI